MNLLHIDSSILSGNSVSRVLSAAIANKLKSAQPDLEIVYRDLAEDPVPHLSGAYLAALQGIGGSHASDLQHDLALSETVLEEFLNADIVVIGVAFYNFSVPSQLKSWIDRILVAGKTFRYGPDGRPEGLAGDKRMILALARGGFYGADSPNQAAEHAETYLRTAFGFIGMTSVEVISAEGIAIGPEQREAAILSGQSQIAVLAA